MKSLLISYLLALQAFSQFANAQTTDIHSRDVKKSREEDGRNISIHSSISNREIYATASSDILRTLKHGDSFVSVTNRIGQPPIVEPIIDLGHINEHKAVTAKWHVFYRHSFCSNIYYKMIFSGKKYQPENLLSTEAVVIEGNLNESIGFLELGDTEVEELAK